MRETLDKFGIDYLKRIGLFEEEKEENESE